jgi:hypothetical protein
MRQLFIAALVSSGLVATAAQSIPPHVCEGPAGLRNPHCTTTPPPDRSVPEPGAAGLFALGAALIALRTRRAS